MKKLLLSILTFVYMLVFSGVAMDIHYCMGQRAGVDLYNTGGDKCARCGMKEKKNGCCHDDHQFHKLEDSHKNVSNDINFEAAEFAIVTDYPSFDWQTGADISKLIPHNNSPPGYSGRDVCIMNCVFRL